VIIEQGAGSPSQLWWPIQEKVAAFARICTYDRAGYGWSEPVRGPRSIGHRAEELHTLLMNAGVPAPYILVAHSYGGLIVRRFAHKYREQMAGLVLVDTADEIVMSQPEVQLFYSRMRLFPKTMGMAARLGVPRLLRRIPALRQGLWFVEPKDYAATADDLASLKHLDGSASNPGALQDLPLVVITHAQPFPGPFAVLEKGWRQAQQRLAALSTQGVLITAEKSNHMIHLDEPDLVIEAIRQMHAGIRELGQGDYLHRFK
jgi:pimeloyl-ACP methyl ester carboxylesterase